MTNHFLDPKNDFAFKPIFGTEKNKDILIHFLNDRLAFKDMAHIEDVTLLNPIQDPTIAAKKESIVNVLCQDQEGRQHIVEMQVVSTKGSVKRAPYDAAKAYSNQLAKGELYHALKEVIFLAITDFTMFPEKKAYKSAHVILAKASLANDLPAFSFTFLALPKFTKKRYELTNMVEKWCYFFKHAATLGLEDVDKVISLDTILQRAYQVIEAVNWNEAELAAYEREKKSKMDLHAAHKQARDEGIKQEI